MALCLQRYTPHKGQVTNILEKRMQMECKRLSRDSTENYGVSFSEHLVIEILSRLPVKSLIKFRTVCKSWYAIIKSNYFIFKHMNNYHSKEDDHQSCLITQYMVNYDGELNVFELLVDDGTQGVLAYEEILTPRYNTYFSGPCDGLYYLWSWSDRRRYLWNPALNELKLLPPLNMKPHRRFAVLDDYFGFGFDSLTNDYKVVVIHSYRDRSMHPFLEYITPREDIASSIFIYSLKINKWRSRGNLSENYYLKRNTCYVFINDSVYWLGSYVRLRLHQQSDLVIVVNLKTNNAQEIKLPQYEEPTDECLVVCHDSLALLLGFQEHKRYTMWYLDDGMIWTNKYTLNLDFGVYTRPIGHWKVNKLLFQGYNKTLVSYDLETEETWSVEAPMRYYGCVYVSHYKESLVSIINRDTWMDHHKQASSSRSS